MAELEFSDMLRFGIVSEWQSMQIAG